MKDQKGITLIALVITIIVLLILAGVAIAMLSGENGLLKKASESASHTALGAAKDEVYVAATEAFTQYYENTYVGNTGTFSEDSVNEAVKAAIKVENKYADGKVTAAWGTSDEEKNKLTLTYTADGTSVVGTLDKGKISWEEITNPTKE